MLIQLTKNLAIGKMLIMFYTFYHEMDALLLDYVDVIGLGGGGGGGG